MKVVFSAARNGSLSCTINNKQYHSLYNPENEASSFCKNTVKPSFKPSVILIIEPGLSYCAGELKKLFPESYKDILALSQYMLTQGNTMYYLEDYTEEHVTPVQGLSGRVKKYC